MELFAHIIGIVGAILVVLAYMLLQFRYITSESKLYDLLNLFGASFILFSLFFEWNTGAALIEISWVIISLFAVFSNKKNKSL